MTETPRQGPHPAKQLPDTARFLSSLQHLAAPHTSPARLTAEQQAAHYAFCWQEEVVVARAPGRMDIMGGIADYSGALVLQMPIAEACHVAVQRQRPAELRQAGLAPGRLTIISFLEADAAGAPGSETDTATRATDACGDSSTVGIKLEKGETAVSRQAQLPGDNEADGHVPRSHVFNAPLSDLYPGGVAMPYDAARAYFKRNASTSWAAYVAGCLLVLSNEMGLTLDTERESVAILVSSEVPEGKGVSSSAAIETATMMAVTAAYGLQVAGRQLAIICQKVENLVVGAPCGIMDQMASALGQEGRLLALLCQPAEVQGCVEVPAALGARFWGIDSGIRHSVGGADYGSVRVGAFMGLRIVRHLLQQQAPSSDHAVPMSCLANIPPSLFLRTLQHQLPESLLGSDFKSLYGPHLDSITTVQDDVRYAVRVPTAHPILDHHRVQTFRQLLLAAATASETAIAPTATTRTTDTSSASPLANQAMPGTTNPADMSNTAETGADASSVAAAGFEAGAGVAAGAVVREEQLSLLGELMFQTHDSYGACGLGCSGTDRLVELVRVEAAQAQAQGHSPPVYGAKITGGGSGGTVCILAAASEAGDDAVRRIAARYAQEAAMPVPPKVFQGSSMGAMQFGTFRIRLSA